MVVVTKRRRRLEPRRLATFPTRSLAPRAKRTSHPQDDGRGPPVRQATPNLYSKPCHISGADWVKKLVSGFKGGVNDPPLMQHHNLIRKSGTGRRILADQGKADFHIAFYQFK